MPLTVGTRLGPYEVLGLLGAGGMGEVYRARDARLDRDVALKVLPDELSSDPDRLRRFEREARALAALTHPNIVSIHDVGSHGGTAYAVMERLEGETLRQSLHRGALPRRKAIEQAIEIARGLGAAHERGIVHRDLKPENVFVTGDGRVKILDFGLARQQQQAGSPSSQIATVTRDTVPGVVLGTVGYMSPEQVRGADVDARSDVFALGCVLYEMLTGRRAFERDTATETMTAILREDPPDITATGPPLSPAVERTMRRCLEKNPAERFQSARDVAFALEAVSVDSRPSGVAAPLPRGPAWRRMVLTAAVGTAVVAGVGLGFIAGWRTAPEGAQLSFDRLTSRQGTVFSARFGPDGRTIVYGAAWEGRPFSLFQTGPSGGEMPLQLENADLASVSRDGQLAILLLTRHGANSWWRRGTLAVIPVIGAAPREVAHDVWGADWAPDGRALAVVLDGAGVTRLEYPLGQVLLARKDARLMCPRVSPAGDHVAFWALDARSGWTVSIVDRSRNLTALSQGWGDAFDLLWSPDGREVWFSASKPCEGEQSAIYAVDLRGQQRVLARSPGTLDLHDVAADGSALMGHVAVRLSTRTWDPDGDRDLSWLEASQPADLSRDGRTRLLNVMSGCTPGSDSSAASFLWPANGEAPVRVAEGFYSGKLSPDGHSVLFAESRRMREVPVGAGATRLIELGFETAPLVPAFEWMPGGDSFVVGALQVSGELTLRVIDARTGKEQSISQAFFRDSVAVGTNWMSPVSPDGRLVAAKAADARILLVPLDGGPIAALPGAEVNELPAQWTEDAGSLFLYSPGKIPCRVYRIDVASGRRTLWKEIHPPHTGATGVGCLYLTRDGRRGVYGYSHAQVDLYRVKGLR